MKRKLLDSGVSTGSFNEITEAILNRARSRQSAYVCVANVHMLIEAHRDMSFARIMDDAMIVTPDGMPLVMALKGLYGIKQERAAGMDLMPALLREAEGQSLKVYLYGSTPEVLTAIQQRCSEQFPNLSWAGIESPPFRPLRPEEEQNVIERINASGANLVLVALGCPKQERWMASMNGKIDAVMVGLGGAFPVFAGLQSRAPQWMQRMSLEWLFRMIQEPGRLWKRYLVTNTVFVGLLFREFWNMKLLRQSHFGSQEAVADF